VTYSNNNKVGNASVTFTGMGDYTGSSVKKTFKIVAPKADKITDTLTINKPDANTIFGYDPNGVRLSSDDLQITSGNRTLFENVDYKVSYKDNKKAGKASYTITFMGDFKGYPALKNQTFMINNPTLEDEGVNVVVDDMVATKKGVYKSKPVVTYNGVKVNANEYKVYYYFVNKTDSNGNPLEMDNKNKIDPATDFTESQYVEIKVVLASSGKTYKVKDNNNDTIYAKKIYKVWKGTEVENSKNLTKAKIDLKTKSLPYDGNPQKLALADITVKTSDGEITGTDIDKYFDVEYYNNINIGKATIIIKAKEGSGYIGSKTATFQITKPTMTK
jgi:hypothetical protein